MQLTTISRAPHPISLARTGRVPHKKRLFLPSTPSFFPHAHEGPTAVCCELSSRYAGFSHRFVALTRNVFGAFNFDMIGKRGMNVHHVHGFWLPALGQSFPKHVRQSSEAQRSTKWNNKQCELLAWVDYDFGLSGLLVVFLYFASLGCCCRLTLPDLN